MLAVPERHDVTPVHRPRSRGNSVTNGYVSITAPDVPNLLMIEGPFGPTGNVSIIDVAERAVGCILQMAALLCDGRAAEIAVTRAAYDDYDRRRVAAAKKTIWASGCRSWYLDAEGVPATWPWTYTAFGEAMARPRLEDYGVAGLGGLKRRSWTA